MTRNTKYGFTLIELLIVMAILIIVGGVIAVFSRDFFSLRGLFEEGFLNERSAEEVIRALVAEVRTASQSSTGAYPLQIVTGNSFSFFVNVDSDPEKERVQYFKNGAELKKSVVHPVGTPLTYATTTATEDLRTVLRDLSSTTTPLFLYYDKNYGGTTTPLVNPVNVLDVRLVKISITVDRAPVQLPPPLTVEGQVSIRNLKDNY
jgi:prepilin-type N-terminal cleavage/methylation domain-containing protein